MSSLAVFLILGGGAAFAAKQLPKNSVGSKQLRKNAVKTGDIAPKAIKTGKIAGETVKAGKIAKNAIPMNRIRDGAVGNSKIGAGAVTGDKIGTAAVTGDKINAPTTPFSRIVASLVGGASVPFTPGQNYPLATPNYIQPAGEVDQYFGSIDVHFPAACTQPRSAVAYLLLDAANPAVPLPPEIVGYRVLTDQGAGAVTRQMAFELLPGGGVPWRPAPSADTPHTFTVRMVGASCTAGGGITANGVRIDVIGTK